MDFSTLSWKEILTISAALLGAVLGIMNTWNSINQRRLRLRVRPAFVTDLAGQPQGFEIEAINLSACPVTIVEAGFEVGNKKRLPLQGGQIAFPHRLESRESFSMRFGPSNFNPPDGVKLGKAYVRTACGNWITGNSPAGRQFSDILAKM